MDRWIELLGSAAPFFSGRVSEKSGQPIQIVLLFFAGLTIINLIRLIGIGTLAPVFASLALRWLDGSIT